MDQPQGHIEAEEELQSLTKEQLMARIQQHPQNRKNQVRCLSLQICYTHALRGI